MHPFIENLLFKAFKMFKKLALKDGIHCQFLVKTSQNAMFSIDFSVSVSDSFGLTLFTKILFKRP